MAFDAKQHAALVTVSNQKPPVMVVSGYFTMD